MLTLLCKQFSVRCRFVGSSFLGREVGEEGVRAGQGWESNIVLTEFGRLASDAGRHHIIGVRFI